MDHVSPRTENEGMIAMDDIFEAACAGCVPELAETSSQGTSDDLDGVGDHMRDDFVTESDFAMYSGHGGGLAAHHTITVQSPAQALFSVEHVSAPTNSVFQHPHSMLRLVNQAQSQDPDDQESETGEEDFDLPEMFEYANPELYVEYIDTDIDLERSLDLREVLEHDNRGANPLLSYRGDKFEDRRIITDDDMKNGMDMQGIRWKQGRNARRDYRQYRVSTYENYFNSNGPFRGPTSTQTFPPHDRSFLRFVQNQIEFKCSLVHFQLRNLLTALDRNAIYHTDMNLVKLYNTQDHTCKTVMDLSDQSITYPFKISSLAMTDDYCCVGGFFGEYALRSMNQEDEEVHKGLVTTDTSGITNHLSPQVRRSGGHQLAISSNDSCLRMMDVETFKITRERHLDHPLNCSATSTDKRIQVAVGDHCSALLLDAENGDILKTIDGHTDYSFACAWSSDGHTFATGSQDLTTRLYDARGSMDTPIAIYRASIGAIRSLKFSECGRFLAVAEPADFVHLHDMHDASKSQCIDFFGEISGIDFAGDSFFIGNADRAIGGIAEFEMRRDRLGLEDVLL